MLRKVIEETGIRLLKPVQLIKGTTVARTALTYTEREDGDGQITKIR